MAFVDRLEFKSYSMIKAYSKKYQEIIEYFEEIITKKKRNQ